MASFPPELIIRSYPLPEREFLPGGYAHENAIVACPHPPEPALREGRAMATPDGEFDAREIAKNLPPGFEPALVDLSARTLRHRPMGLEVFPCPKVMKIGDTHHLGDGTLRGIVSYCRDLGSTHHWCYQNVRHLHYLVEAGMKNVFWLPGSIVLPPYADPPSRPEPEWDVVFRGSRGAYHPYRDIVLAALEKLAGTYRVSIGRNDYEGTLADYRNSRIVLNISGNGDLNRRVYETLLCGGFLLTDRLPPESALYQQFEEGRHLACYSDVEEMLEKIHHYLAAPEERDRIARAGQDRLREWLPGRNVREMLHEIVLGSKPLPDLFSLGHDRRAFRTEPLNIPGLYRRMAIYEAVQEVHGLNARLDVLCLDDHDPALLSDLADMPRIFLYAHQNDAAELSEVLKREQTLDRVKVSEGGAGLEAFRQRMHIVISPIGDGTNLGKAVTCLQPGGLLLLRMKDELGTKARLRLDLGLNRLGVQPVTLKTTRTVRTDSFRVYRKSGQNEDFKVQVSESGLLAHYYRAGIHRLKSRLSPRPS